MMNRRLLPAGALAAAMFPLLRPAQAQGPSPSRTPAPSAPPAQSSAPPGSAAAARDMALAGGAFSMQSSDLAKTRATAPAVRQFAELESEEQRAVMQALQIAGVPVPSSIQLPVEMA